MAGKSQRKTRQYSPVQGPQQRRKLLKELGRKQARKKFSISPREVRRNVGKMFGFAPLTSLTAAESSLLRSYVRMSVQNTTADHIKYASMMLSGQARRSVGFGDESQRMTRQTIRKLYSEGKRFDKTRIRYTEGRITTGKGLGGYGCRGLEEYSFDILKRAREAYKRKGSRIQVLDVGSMTGKMLAELKSKMGDKVETHALSPDDMPKQRVDAYHMLVAERMPKEFRRRFDVIVSNRTLEYSLFPNIALQNIAQSLAPGGKAYLQWHGGRTVWARELRSRLTEFFARYSKAKPSQGAKQIIKEGAAVDKQTLTDAQVDAKIKQGIERYGSGARQNLAWCNEIAKLRKSPQFDVQIVSWSGADFGWAPGHLIIERKR
ncbi:MAG: methyltransferase domain-containing protein [Candidatus Diapherotrites archaeon]